MACWNSAWILVVVAVISTLLSSIHARSDENYRCSETGYRIPFKCIEIGHDTKNENGKQHSQNGRSAAEISDNLNPHISLQDAASNEGRILLDGSSPAKDGAQIYITYRSCIAANAEKLSVHDFEVSRCLCNILSGGRYVSQRICVSEFCLGKVEPQNGSLEVLISELGDAGANPNSSSSGIILCFLLASGSVVYFRRKRTITRASGAGPGSIQMNSRF
ncbi:hypothetical protein SADUNF_Sadunf08G0157100 [Salix dunnii]|uniref:Uncharacterized protein n=1 Tax=Salix dunnii TaxID=1413687 RepID=A0A835K1P1_9ROSI|nr:hypothetical protein SADUNF_Sadunf08G0157100 [Salix dunnii]